MKKTVTINLNSFIFNIDEDAYQVLKTYLDKLTAHFSKSEEGREILKDIEARLAELFNGKINSSKQVIEIEDVEEAISVLGDVEEIIDSDESEKQTETKFKKKFYRDIDSKMLGGVCAGLSAYTGLHVAFWRILFLILLFIPGNIGLIAYLILWIAVPGAKTTAQKLEMKGEQVNLSNIEKTVKEEYENLKENLKNMNSKRFSDFMERLGAAILSAFKIVAKVIAPVLGVAFILGGIILTVVLLVAFLSVGPDNIIYTNSFMNFVSLPAFFELATSSDIAWLLTVSIFVLIIIPVIALIYVGILLILKINGNKYLNIGLVIAWIFSLFLTIVLSIMIADGYKSFNYTTQIEHIPVDSTNYYSFALQGDDKFLSDYKRLEDFSGKKALKVGVSSFVWSVEGRNFFIDKDIIRISPTLNFKPFDGDSPELSLRYFSRGRNEAEVKSNIGLISYDYNITDSIVSFAPFFIINERRWKAQDLELTVKLPYESRIYIDKSLAKIIKAKDVTGKYKDRDLAGKSWIVTREGLIISSD